MSSASVHSSRAASPIRDEISAPLSLDAILHSTQSAAPSIRADDSVTLDGRSVVGSVTSERRKPRKLDIRSVAKKPAEPPAEEVPDAINVPATEQTQPPLTEPRKRRRPRKLNRATDDLADIREESRGGVPLDQSLELDAADKTSPQDRADPPEADTVDTTAELNEPPSDPVRRRPRKLERNRQPITTPAAQHEPETVQPTPPKVPIKSEIEALKDRVKELEAQVRELYERPAISSARSPRRRGKGRKSSADATTQSEELTRLQAELVDAQNQLAALRIQQGASIADTTRPSPRPGTGATRSTRSSRTRPRPHGSAQAVSDDEVEDIARTSIPGAELEQSAPQKAVTLSGSYKIRLPNNLDIKDVKALQDGVTSATNIAKTLAASRSATPRKEDREGDGKSWGEWFGSYSQSIARIMHNVEAEAAMESTHTEPRRDQQWTSGVKTTPQRTVRRPDNNAIVARRRPMLDRASSSSMTPQTIDGLLR